MPNGFFGDIPSAVPEAPPEDTGMGALGVGAGVVGAVALAALLRKPGALAKLNAIRQQLMLTGKAIPKSFFGNVGAVVTEAAETGSMNPLKQFFSRQTLQDAKAAYAANAPAGYMAGASNTTASIPFVNPGRIMGSLDTATQAALRRSGMSADAAEASLFQTPLGKNFGKLGDVMDSPEARYMVPFRRTPLNQVYEGAKAIKESGPYAQWQGIAKHPGTFNAYTAAGAVHGAATSDDDYPLSVPLAISGAAKYGLPYGAAAIVGRMLAGGNKNSGAAGTMLPVSEYGITQSLTDPTAPFFDPAFLRTYGE